MGEGAEMSLRQAVRIAAKALDDQAQRLAITANLYDIYRLEAGEKAAAERRKIRQARAVICEWEKEAKKGNVRQFSLF
jgi:hypothetical protein